jgi:hypothetical protein
MTRHREPRRGDGSAWLVADRLKGDYLCYWYVGEKGDRVANFARVPTATAAVAWGRLRTTRVRIRTGEARAYWAGGAPRPAGFSHTWTEPCWRYEALPQRSLPLVPTAAPLP